MYNKKIFRHLPVRAISRLSVLLAAAMVAAFPRGVLADDIAVDEGVVQMKVGLQKIDGKKYYFNKDGTMLKNSWQQIGDKRYYFTGSGAAKVSSWLTYNGKKYYFGPGGVMKTGWREVDGKYYYLGDDGAYDSSYIHPANLKIGKTASQVVVTSVANSKATTATTAMFNKKSNGKWKEIVRSDGYVGREGVGKTSEGMSRTPAGTYNLKFAFGIKPNPGCKVAYTKVNKYHYWVGDSKSPKYNQFVDMRKVEPFNIAESEHLIDVGYVYNYCMWIDYNKEATPYAGSAFFLHCQGGRPTGGCVSVQEADMITILRNVKKNCKIIIDTVSRLKSSY